MVCFVGGSVPLGCIKGQNDQMGSHDLSRMLCGSVQHNMMQA